MDLIYDAITLYSLFKFEHLVLKNARMGMALKVVLAISGLLIGLSAGHRSKKVRELCFYLLLKFI